MMSTAAVMAIFGLAYMGVIALIGLVVWAIAETPAVLLLAVVSLMIWLVFCGLFRIVGGPE